MKIAKSDYKFVPLDPEVGFSEEHNKKVIEEVIKESEAYARKKRRMHAEAVDERAQAIAQYLKDVDMGGKETDVKKYFGEDHLNYLKGLSKMEQIRQIYVQKNGKIFKKNA